MDALFAHLLNRLLADQHEAAARLSRHAGKRLRIVLPLARIALSVGGDGRFSAAGPAPAFDCEITLPPHVLAQLPLLGGAALAGVRVTGDGVLAGDLSSLLKGLDWAVLLAPILGPSLAARADQSLHGLARWQDEARLALARSLAEYLVYEAGVLAEGAAVRSLVREVDELRDAADRLAARIALLEARGGPPAGPS